MKTSENHSSTYTVNPGDTLWSIARSILGRASRYTEIVSLNGMKFAVVYVGQRLMIPRK